MTAEAEREIARWHRWIAVHPGAAHDVVDAYHTGGAAAFEALFADLWFDAMHSADPPLGAAPVMH